MSMFAASQGSGSAGISRHGGWVPVLQADSQCSSHQVLVCSYVDAKGPGWNFNSFQWEALPTAGLWRARTKANFTVTLKTSGCMEPAAWATSHTATPNPSKMGRKTTACQFPSKGPSQHGITHLLTLICFCCGTRLLLVSSAAYTRLPGQSLARTNHLNVWVTEERRDELFQGISHSECKHVSNSPFHNFLNHQISPNIISPGPVTFVFFICLFLFVLFF